LNGSDPNVHPFALSILHGSQVRSGALFLFQSRIKKTAQGSISVDLQPNRWNLVLMRVATLMMRLAVVFGTLLFFVDCRSTGGVQSDNREGSTVIQQESTSDESIVTEIDVDDDPFLSKPADGKEYFRVLIARDLYAVKQISPDKRIDRKPDQESDIEQFKNFQKFTETYDFKDWVFEGKLNVRLNPHTGIAEHIDFVPGFTPVTWQVSKLFQEDVSRFRYVFTGSEIQPTEFVVSYEWRIKKRKGLTEEEAKKKVSEFLRSQIR